MRKYAGAAAVVLAGALPLSAGLALSGHTTVAQQRVPNVLEATPQVAAAALESVGLTVHFETATHYAGSGWSNVVVGERHSGSNVYLTVNN